MCLYVFIWAMCEKYEIMLIAPLIYVQNASWNMNICMICYLKPYDIIAWLWGAKVWLWEMMKWYVYEKWWKCQSMPKWWCIACYTVKESMKREWIDTLSIGIWLTDWLTVFSSHRNRNVGSIVSLRYNVGDTVLPRLCRWSRVTEV